MLFLKKEENDLDFCCGQLESRNAHLNTVSVHSYISAALQRISESLKHILNI